MDWTLPANLSVHGADIDRLYYIILAMTALAFFLVLGGIGWFLVRYRHREGRRALYHHGDSRLEVGWTVGLAVVFLVLAVYSGQVWVEIKMEDHIPEDALTLQVHAEQFEWNTTYPGADGELGTEDDFVVRNHIHIPAHRPVVVELTSEDVIHSFFVPELRVKQAAVPGMTTRVWFEATGTGELELACAELCGIGHYRMRAFVTIYEPEEFDAWHAERSERALARDGRGALASR